MKKILKIVSVMMALMLVLAFTGCKKQAEPASDDGQNPIMNYVGNYGCDRASIMISADGDEGASAIVTWSSSAAENSSWTMSGTFDADTLQFEYHDCVRTDYIYNESGEVDSQEEVYTGGHGFMTFKEGDDGTTLTWQDDQEHIADDMVFIYNGVTPGDGEMTGLANPWSDADSAEAAAEGAGLDLFQVPDGIELSLGTVAIDKYRYMDGMAEADGGVAAVELTIRKGRADTAMVPEDTAGKCADISGDYNQYKHSWTQNVKGLEVECFGNREGEATKAIWQVEDTCWSINAIGAGGDEDFGLSADDLNSMVNAMQ